MITLVVILSVLALIALSFPTWRRRVRIARWRKRLQLDHYQHDFTTLYQSIDGFKLSKLARLKADDMEYVYGEIEFTSFIALLSLCNINTNTVFYDLGSGVGKAVIAAAMVFELNHSYGIELLTPLHETANAVLARLRQVPGYAVTADKITFKQGDIWQESLRDATLVFVNATAFFAERWRILSTHITQVAANTLVISTSKALESDDFILEAVKPLHMSWGIVNAYMQRKKPTI